MNDIDASIQQYEWETRSPVLTIPWPEPPCSKRQEPRVYVLWSYESYVISVQPIHTISYLRFISNQSNRSLKFPCGVGMPCAARHPVARWGLSSSIATPHCFRQLRWAVSSSDTRVTSGPYIGCSRFKRVPSVFKPFIAFFLLLIRRESGEVYLRAFFKRASGWIASRKSGRHGSLLRYLVWKSALLGRLWSEDAACHS